MLEEAEKHALAGVDRARSCYGSSLTFARFFYGRVLRLQGKNELVIKFFNPYEVDNNLYWHPSQGSPAIVFGKEYSSEYRGYLRELLNVGVVYDRRRRGI